MRELVRQAMEEGALGIANGVLSFMLVIGLLPILEYLFKIPTDITLLTYTRRIPLSRPIVAQWKGPFKVPCLWVA